MQNVTFERAGVDEEYEPLIVNPDGTMKCPRGFALVRDEDGIYRCEGGHHRYALSDASIMFDKFGNPIVRKNSAADAKEANAR
jgi:hypothetical protein